MSILISITSYVAKEAYWLNQCINYYAKAYADLNPHFALAINYPIPTESLSDPYRGIGFIIARPNNLHKFDYGTGSINNFTCTSSLADTIANTSHTLISSSLTGWDYTWACKEYMQANYTNYDYVLEADADLILPRASFNSYIANPLPLHSILGFMVVEQDKQGHHFLITTDRARQNEARTTIDGKEYIVPKHLHSACFLADKARYAAVANQITPIPAGRIIVPSASRSLIYTKYQKVVDPSGLHTKSAYCYHLPNKYYWRGQARPHTDAEYIAKLAK